VPLEYLIEYGMFLAKAATIVLAAIIIVAAISSAGQKKKKAGKKGSIKVTQLNDHIDEMRDVLRQTVLDKGHLKLVHKDEKKKSNASLHLQSFVLQITLATASILIAFFIK